MAKKFSFLVMVLFLFTNVVFGQNPIPQNFTEVVTVDSLSKEQLYDNAKAWVLTKFMTADNMVQFDDKEHSFIFATAHIVMDKKKYLFGKAGFPVNTDNNTLTFKLELNFKDNKFKYEIKNILYSYDRRGGRNVEGHEETSLNDITGMTSKIVPDVQEEAIEKIKDIIHDMKVKTKYSKNKSDW